MKKSLSLVFFFCLLFSISASMAYAGYTVRDGRNWQNSQYSQNTQNTQNSQNSQYNQQYRVPPYQAPRAYTTSSGSIYYYSPNYIQGYTYCDTPTPGYYLYPKTLPVVSNNNYGYTNTDYIRNSTSHWPVASDYYTTPPVKPAPAHWPVASDYYTTPPVKPAPAHWPVASDYYTNTKDYGHSNNYNDYGHHNSYNKDNFGYDNHHYVEYYPNYHQYR